MLASIPLPADPVGDLIIVLGYWGLLFLIVGTAAWAASWMFERQARRRRRVVRRTPVVDLTAKRHTRSWDWPDRDEDAA